MKAGTVVGWHRKGFRLFWRWKIRSGKLGRPASQTWRAFLENHTKSMVSVDFFTVPTTRFQILYVFLVLAHERRRIIASPEVGGLHHLYERHAA